MSGSGRPVALQFSVSGSSRAAIASAGCSSIRGLCWAKVFMRKIGKHLSSVTMLLREQIPQKYVCRKARERINVEHQSESLILFRRSITETEQKLRFSFDPTSHLLLEPVSVPKRRDKAKHFAFFPPSFLILLFGNRKPNFEWFLFFCLHFSALNKHLSIHFHTDSFGLLSQIGFAHEHSGRLFPYALFRHLDVSSAFF